MNKSYSVTRYTALLGLILALWSPLPMRAQSVMADVNGDGVPDEIYPAQTLQFTATVGSASGGCASTNFNNFWFGFTAFFFPSNDYSPDTRLNMNVYFGPQGYCPTTYVQMIVQIYAYPGNTYRVIADYNGGTTPANLIGRSGTDYTGDGPLYISQPFVPVPIAQNLRYWVVRLGPPADTSPPIEGSPAVSSVAYDAAIAALDGGARYSQAFIDNILASLNPVNWAESFGATAGYVANIVDAGTRVNTVYEIKQFVDQVQTSQYWKEALAQAITPEGLAGITSGIVQELIPTPFGNVKIPELAGVSALDNIPNGRNIAIAKARIGATGRIGEEFLEDLYNAHVTGITRQVRKGTPSGARILDVFVDGVAHESKVGATYLTATVEKQLQKDIQLLSNKSSGVNEVVWHFQVSPQTGVGGPSQPLIDRINALRAQGHNISYEIRP